MLVLVVLNLTVNILTWKGKEALKILLRYFKIKRRRRGNENNYNRKRHISYWWMWFKTSETKHSFTWSIWVYCTCQNLSYTCSQTLVVMHDLPGFAARPHSKVVEKAGKPQHWFLLFLLGFLCHCCANCRRQRGRRAVEMSQLSPPSNHTTKKQKRCANHPPATRRELAFSLGFFSPKYCTGREGTCQIFWHHISQQSSSSKGTTTSCADWINNMTRAFGLHVDEGWLENENAGFWKTSGFRSLFPSSC